jgi:hypothetical protein
MYRSALAFLLLLAALPAQAQEDRLLSYWSELGPDGVIEVRAAVSGSHCPMLFVSPAIDARMWPRAAADANFPLLCAARLPHGTSSAWIAGKGLAGPAMNYQIEVTDRAGKSFSADVGWTVPLPVSDPHRILVLGDTGCRIKGAELQACDDPAKWPFPEIAKAAAALKPDLVIHVGDYLYRENACPAGNTGCAGTPFGDNWPTWAADFFDPAASLLAAAPFVFVRGNHEDCQRAGPGWLRLLGPLRYDATCTAHLAPYNVPLAAMNLIVMDDADAPDTSVDAAMVSTYKSEIAALADAPTPSWLLMHRPIWAAISGPLGIPIGGNKTLITAIGDAGIPSPVALLLAGHIHSFEALNYDAKVPPQIVAGFSGDNLDVTPHILKGAVFQGSSGVHVKDGLSVGGFGFLLMTKTDTGWTIDLYDMSGTVERQCVFAQGRVDCARP